MGKQNILIEMACRQGLKKPIR